MGFTSEVVSLHLRRNEKLSSDSIFASCQTHLSFPSFASFSFPQLSKVILQAVRQGETKDVKKRRMGNEK